MHLRFHAEEFEHPLVGENGWGRGGRRRGRRGWFDRSRSRNLHRLKGGRREGRLGRRCASRGCRRPPGQDLGEPVSEVDDFGFVFPQPGCEGVRLDNREALEGVHALEQGVDGV